MANGQVMSICISTKAGAKMMEVSKVFAEVGKGLVGDRYYDGNGSFNRGNPGKRQVTLMNAMFFPGSGFAFTDSRRNIFVTDVELMYLIGREFKLGDAVFRGVKYCDPCERPNKLSGIEASFRQAFFDRGGLVTEIIQSGIICVGAAVVPPKKSY